MHKLYSFTAAVLVTVAFANPVFAGEVTSGSQSGSWSNSGVNIGSASQAPSAIAPGLIASGLSCSGSASIGGSGAGWGLSLGITHEDKHCNAREDAKYISGITGNVGAAMARLCMIKENREAFALSGTPCPQDMQVRSARVGESRQAQPIKVVRSFNSMAECRRYARGHSGVSCRAR